MNNNLDIEINDLFLKQIESTLKTSKKPDPWLTQSKLRPIKLLSIDERGRNGQEFLQAIFKLAGFKTAGDNEKTGEWDIKIQNWRIEVKSACRGRSGTFQHESLKNTNNYDFVFFLDVDLDKIYFGCCTYNEIPWDHLHYRAKANRPTGAGYKWDFNPDSKKSIKLPAHYGIVNTVGDVIKIFNECLSVFENSKK